MAFRALKYRAGNAYDVEEASNEATIPADQQGESLTIQSMSEDADINVLMRRYGITGKFPENPRIPIYGDFTNVKDFQSALNALQEAEDGFMQLPADVRARFQNNPQLLLEFLDKPENVDDAIKLGLLNESAMRGREEYWKKDKAAKHAALLEAAHAAGLELKPAEPAKPAPPAAPSKT